MRPALIGTIVLSVPLIILTIPSCSDNSVVNIKDLNENMVDIRIYQENVGDYVRSGNLEDGKWLLKGMDSILRIVSNKFDQHRKLSKPFSYFYKQKLKGPINKLKRAFNTGDTALARKQYRILVRKCNGCHIEHDIGKKVRY